MGSGLLEHHLTNIIFYVEIEFEILRGDTRTIEIANIQRGMKHQINER